MMAALSMGVRQRRSKASNRRKVQESLGHGVEAQFRTMQL